jgi:hypothetical protein
MSNKKLNTIYIISKGRPQCKTARTLTNMNYMGEWFIVCGNNDETIPEYQKNWGKDRILFFDWYEEVKKSDLLDNFGVEKMSSGAVPVRNAIREISEKRGELRHWQFDDDYEFFTHTRENFKSNFAIREGKFFEKQLYKLAKYAHEADLANVGFCLGHEAFPVEARNVSRRVFNTHNLPSKIDKFVDWKGRLNDDLINALDVFGQGKVEMSFKFIHLKPAPTQSEQGGLSDLYKQEGTVRKTAYAILKYPNVVKLTIKFGRYHHQANWEKITPKVIRETYAKV